MNHLINAHRHCRTIYTTSTQRSIRAWKWCMYIIGRCTSMQELKAIHSIFITHGLHRNNYAVSKLLDFCALADCGDLSYASLLFTQLPSPSCYLYNTLIKAYSTSPQPHLALRCFNLMLRSLLPPDGYTFPFVLIACSNGCFTSEGEQLHCWVTKNGLASANPHVQTALIRFYAASKSLVAARQLFGEITDSDVVQCNVLISGYVKCGMASEALDVFRGMLLRGVEPDEFCLTTGLTACAKLGALEQGKWIHEYIRRRNLMGSDTFIGTQLVDMYAKCGCIDMAVEVFESIPKRNKFSWASMIGGFAAHGYARKAIDCLERMQAEDGIKPDGIVILGVLAACTHAGLPREGQFLLNNMETLYGVPPEHEHYSCIVDLLCRAGQLCEALELIRSMPMKALASVWGAFLSGCRMNNNVILAELAVKELLQLEGGNEAEESSAYVQLSNIYLAAQKCEDARRFRRMIGDRGLKKAPGCSAIEIDGEVNEFVSGDVSHHCLANICAILDLVSTDLSIGRSWQMEDLAYMQ
ncbi:putative pentatricopeptide repeat-containing protein At3g28640 [Coffea arabica]|uniref:Pentatricopeptide repeat-containing protein At3g28640 n=1 Tax=Coffea arabica TaxID=13443 RepID=A0A6P6TA21_COFAR|nr:putative pentatricopeptide repeat-containing protein At3g28640 [Coffea arabica]